MNELALFAGIGGGLLATKQLGFTTVCAVEIDHYCQSVLVSRQADRLLPIFPIWDDVRTFDGWQWRGVVELVSGGFPCQDVSKCGSGKGLNGERSGLWSEFKRIISEVKPAFVFIENSPLLAKRGLDKVLSDVASIGYDAEWDCFSAREIGAPHKRERIWILAFNPNSRRCLSYWKKREMGDLQKNQENYSREASKSSCKFLWGRLPERGTCGVDDGLPGRMERVAACGNGQVPYVAEKAWHVLCQRAAARTLKKRDLQQLTAAVCNTAGH